MDPARSSLDAGYMAMLTRNIPGVGVGNAPLNSAVSPPTILTNKNLTGAALTLTDKQRHAIGILDSATKDAIFVSEGDEPFQTVHLIPKQSDTHLVANNTSAPSPLPTASELLTLLKDAQLISADDDDDEETPIEYEQSFDLKAILSSSNPGAQNIADALQQIFQYDLSHGNQTNPTVALYRVILPSSPTEVHLWILGWVDQHLLGFHTISIES
ncbi:hypothetical protein BGZ80_006530 [Entomortierella chlamydospora]|uniref:Uncharacterized protein n=1 Tax=Entomortierella chlamydospora TaxID=101097 RepID=A0A9P6T1T2_9FUNG|nr:hypothetical protein BGZ79_007428 [Entomortierella chlamydospora]KAG0018930.1 hypothetical protein BGZ80_006530 [Entomortierella chlamydospora]